MQDDPFETRCSEAGGAPGWQRDDLVDASVRRAHPHGRCTRFASARTLGADGQGACIHLAMVVSDASGDHLYLSLSNPAPDRARRVAPAWTACPFDAGLPPARLAIERLMLGDAGDRCYVVVELAAGAGLPGDAAPSRRYYIDAGRHGAPRWAEHRAPLAAGTEVHASCLGRSRGAWQVDGVYLAARLGERARLLYAPLCHPFAPAQPIQARRLSLPGELAAETMAACRHADHSSTLFVTAGGALYFFAPTNQFDGAQGVRLLADPSFEGLRALQACDAGGRVTLRGVTAAGQLVTTSVDQAYLAEPERWLRPCVLPAGAAAGSA